MTLEDLCVEILTGLWLSAGTLWALAAVRLWVSRVKVTQQSGERRRAGWRSFAVGAVLTASAVAGFLAPAHVLVYNNLTTHLHSFVMEGLGVGLLNISAVIMLGGLDRALGRGRIGVYFYALTSLVSVLLGAALAAL